MARTRRILKAVVCSSALLYALFLPGVLNAIPPPYVSDERLVQHPIIVVGKWTRAPLEPHSLTEGNVLKEMEVRTELLVERVIKGSIKPGRHRILLGFRIGWDEEGGRFGSYMSTEMSGEVENVTDSNLWFLSSGRSWDEKDPSTYLILETYRGVQPAKLEPYFLALASGNPSTEVPKLLSSAEPAVLLRVLEYVAGGILPWPYDPDEFEQFVYPKDKKAVLAEHAEAVKKLIQNKSDRVRRVAAAVYAEMAGAKCVNTMRELLDHEDTHVAAIAAGALIRFRDTRKTGDLHKAAEQIFDGHLACKLIQELEAWGEEKAVPILISFLQNDDFVYVCGDDVGIPAFKARAALKKLTGCDFPLDVSKSMEAWKKADATASGEDRKKLLAKLLSNDLQPLKAELVNEDDSIFIVVTNRSKEAVTLAKGPSDFAYRSSGGIANGTNFHVTNKESFVKLAGGKSIRLWVGQLPDSFLASPPETREVALHYWRNGNEYGFNAWMGKINVSFAEGWSDPPGGWKTVEERWPNGNLKCRGRTRNGEKELVWTYWREDGTKEKEVEYCEDQIVDIREELESQPETSPGYGIMIINIAGIATIIIMALLLRRRKPA